MQSNLIIKRLRTLPSCFTYKWISKSNLFTGLSQSENCLFPIVTNRVHRGKTKISFSVPIIEIFITKAIIPLSKKRGKNWIVVRPHWKTGFGFLSAKRLIHGNQKKKNVACLIRKNSNEMCSKFIDTAVWKFNLKKIQIYCCGNEKICWPDIAFKFIVYWNVYFIW